NLWAQTWDNIVDLIVPDLAARFNLDRKLKGDRKWTVPEMARRAEAFYTSMSLPPMTAAFWRESRLENQNGRQCHGTAANMFQQDDYRILMCAESSMEDFYVLHHELGHIQYYMAYKDQPAIFQDDANSAFHESIGDAIMFGVMTPDHLERLGLINSADDPDLDIYLLLRSALNKLPQLGFGLALEQWRWGVQAGGAGGHQNLPSHWNTLWWRMRELHQGIQPPTLRSDSFHFDPAAKFHIVDNTPYIRFG
ncbi:angiotensin-converting enzyme-like, partial [Nilaparvata lugens]|uniref:angiotensin-converting enzyme-like n=1 Tax=Nilaparvata lugens TaxID=108931 RepID=UPI00193E7898